MTLQKARLIELNETFTDLKGGGLNVPVQFNPESLKISYTNKIVEPKGGDNSAGTAGRQFAAEGVTKLSLQLWFDVTAMEAITDPENTGEKGIVDDVRRLTQQVVFFITPKGSDSDPKKAVPPGLRFVWGSFSFDGMVEGIEETIEFFSPEGKPLRASIALTLSALKYLVRDKKKDTGNLPSRPGHTPLKVARQGDSLQAMAARSGKDDWQGIAAAHGIEDALRMSPGQFIDVNASLGTGISVGAGASLDVGAALGANATVSAGLNASLGGSASASISFN